MKNVAAYGGAVLAILVIVFAFISFYEKSPGADLIRAYGWEIGSAPIDSASFVIPAEFEDVYQNYNKLQIEAGLDLEPYKNKPAKRYTYEVKNYPDCPYNVRANVIIVDHTAVAGDICTVEPDGFMHALSRHPDST